MKANCPNCNWQGSWPECVFEEIPHEYENGEKEIDLIHSCPNCGEVLFEELKEDNEALFAKYEKQLSG